MNKTRKVLILIISVFCLVGCFGNMTPSEKVENMLNKYIKNDKDIIDELETYMIEQDLSEAQRKRYTEIIKDEYATIEYNIVNENIEGEKATVEVEIEVKDLYKASKEAGDYLVENAQEFYTDDIYDESKFIDYKLSVMESSDAKVNYTIYISLIKEEGVWKLEELDRETLEKIHGIYDHENEYQN